MQSAERARAHAALGDEHRLAIVDALAAGDRTVAELGAIAGIPGNLLAHHLDVLDEAGLVERRVSAGDRRRRYVTLRWDRLPHLPEAAPVPSGRVAFVCTHNSARSPFAAAAWEQATRSRRVECRNPPRRPGASHRSRRRRRVRHRPDGGHPDRIRVADATPLIS